MLPRNSSGRQEIRARSGGICRSGRDGIKVRAGPAEGADADRNRRRAHPGSGQYGDRAARLGASLGRPSAGNRAACPPPGDNLVRANGVLGLVCRRVRFDRVDHLVGVKCDHPGLQLRESLSGTKMDPDTHVLLPGALGSLGFVNAAEVAVSLPYPHFRQEGTRVRWLFEGRQKFAVDENPRAITLQGEVVQDLVSIRVRFLVCHQMPGPNLEIPHFRTLVLAFGASRIQAEVGGANRQGRPSRGWQSEARSLWDLVLRPRFGEDLGPAAWARRRLELVWRLTGPDRMTRPANAFPRATAGPLSPAASGICRGKFGRWRTSSGRRALQSVGGGRGLFLRSQSQAHGVRAGFTALGDPRLAPWEKPSIALAHSPQFQRIR